jgi:hypothetical protein
MLRFAERGLTGAIYLNYPQLDAGDDPFARPRIRRARPLSPLRPTLPPRSRAEARFRNLLPSFLLGPRSEGAATTFLPRTRPVFPRIKSGVRRMLRL